MNLIMGKRGPKARNIVKTNWTPKLAYAIGLLASDGCLSPAGHLIDLTTKDLEQARNYKRCLGLKVKIGIKGHNRLGEPHYHVQFKNVIFYEFLESVGLTPKKSKTIGSLKIPTDLFFDFLRGAFDGDGSTYSYFDKRWRSSFMFYTGFVSASEVYINWLRKEVERRLKISGHITRDGKRFIWQLKYAKSDSLKLLTKMYHSKKVICLTRKRLKIEKMLRTIGRRL